MVTLETAERLIALSRPRGGLRGSSLILLGLSILLMAMLADPDVLGLRPPLRFLAPQTAFLGIVGVILNGIARHRRLERWAYQVFEAALLQEWDRAEPLLVRLLSSPVRHPQMRAELLLGLASVAEARQEYGAAQRIYESILGDQAGDPLQLHTARVMLASAMLRTGQLTDAVALLDRLARADLPEPLKAQVELIALLREVILGQAQDNLALADRRRRLFRDHLGTRAGYGYGLLAAAYDRADQPDAARRLWHDATLLIRPGELLQRFRELEPLAGKYPEAEIAL